MSCTQKQQLVCFPKVRVYKPWFRHFNDHKDFRNEGTVHLFSLMALFSYANFRSNERVINGDRYMEAPGQWICKLGSLPRILRVHSKTQALELMEYFQNHGFLTFEILDEEKEILRFTIADWKEHCTHLQYNYYSYKGSGFFFFPLPVGRLLLKTARKEVGIVFSELDAIMDMWLHTILNDPKVRGSEYMPVVYYSNMRGMPLLSYTYLARRWGWSKSRVGRFMLKAGEYGIISRVSFSSSRGSVISMCRYREMIYGEGCEELELSRIGEIIGIAIMRLGKLQPVSIPEFSLWSMLLWDVLTYEELHKKFYDKMEETEIEPSSFDKSLEMLVKRKLIIKGVGYTGADALYNMLSDTYVIPLRGVQGTRKLMNVAKLLKQKKVNFFEAVYLLQPEKSSVAERRIMKLVLQTPLSVPELVRCFENDVRDVSSADKVISAIYTEESDNQARLNNASSLSD